jgi:restriction system protein
MSKCSSLILGELNAILPNTFSVDDTIHFHDLLIKNEPPPFTVDEAFRRPAKQPDRNFYLNQSTAPSRWSGLLPGAMKKHQENLQRLNIDYLNAVDEWQVAEKIRCQKIADDERQHANIVTSFLQKKLQQNEYVEEFQENYKAGNIDSIEEYCHLVLERSEYPDNFPRQFELSYTSQSRQLIVELTLPSIDVVPSVAEYSYVQKNDEIREKIRKASDIKLLYQDVISSIALRTLHEIFEADQGNHIDVVCFNGMIEAPDRSNGRIERKCLISVRTTKSDFQVIDLRYIDRNLCIRNLGAQVSRNPDEVIAVKPIVDLSMVDKRFVDQTNLLSELDEAFNLMDLDPFQFEHLVANLFGKMGLETKLTQSSRDGGVDCIE